MQNVIIPKIQRDVSYPLDTRIVLPFLVGEKDTIPPLQIVGMHVRALFNLRAGIHL